MVDASALARLADGALRDTGMGSVGLYTFGPRGMTGVIRGMPDAFIRQYETVGARIDPVLRNMKRTGAPCSTVTCLGEDWPRSELYRRVSGRFGLTGFAALPLYDETDLVGILYLGALDRPSVARLGPEGLCALSIHATRVSTALKALPRPHPRLTARQDGVARLAAAGLSNREIAGELRTGEAAVRKHLKALNQVFGTTNRTAMAARWREGAR